MWDETGAAVRLRKLIVAGGGVEVGKFCRPSLLANRCTRQYDKTATGRGKSRTPQLWRRTVMFVNNNLGLRAVWR
jgi:hypothetical protein